MSEVIIDAVQTIPVMIVDDQPPFRAVSRTVVSLASDFEVSSEVDSGEDAVDEALRSRPSMVLMDINLGGINGVEATRRITSELPGTVVVLMSTYDADSLPDGAMTCGAARYVHKEDLSPQVLREIWDDRHAV